MGGAISVGVKLSENELLRKFGGLEPMTDNDPFWNRMLSFNLNIDLNSRNETKSLELSVSDQLEALMYNTQTTGNFAAFVRVFLRRAAELKQSILCEDKIFLWQTANALLILRFICKFFAQRMSESEFAKVFTKRLLTDEGQMETLSDSEEPFENTAEEFLNALVEIVVDLDINKDSLPVHVEAVRCLISILSSKLYRESVQDPMIFENYLMRGRCSVHAPLLTKALLRNFLNYNTPSNSGNTEQKSVVLGFAASMWSVVQYATGFESEEERDEQEQPVTLASLSILLLLDLACHQQTEQLLNPNPYRQTLSAFHNAQEVTSLEPSSPVVSFKLDYSQLYDRLCTSVTLEAPMLLLYLLLHRNVGFRNYVLSRVNLENLILPVLKVLYCGQKEQQSNAKTVNTSNSHHIYLVLIVVLMFSEDDFFCKIVHETTLKQVDWFESDRAVGELTLGGLIILVLTRTIQVNTFRTRDRYLHTNCLAALANMSANFKNLSPMVCQKLIALLEILTKKHVKLIEHIRMSAAYDLSHSQQQNQAYQQDIIAVEEGIRTLLEIINSCLTNNLRSNPNLVYTILYKRDLFLAFQNHPMFQDLIWNISTVINHFAQQVQCLDREQSSVRQLMSVIEKAALHWPTDRLSKFPELKFKYVEDDNTVDFFVPYVCRLIFRHSSLYWDPTHIKLFNANHLC